MEWEVKLIEYTKSLEVRIDKLEEEIKKLRIQTDKDIESILDLVMGYDP